MSNPYSSDEYWDDESEFEEDWEPEEWSVSEYLVKGKNGHLAISVLTLGKYPGEDWGMASYEDEDTVNLNQLIPEIKNTLIELGKTMEPGSSMEIWVGMFEDEDEDGDELESVEGEIPY